MPYPILTTPRGPSAFRYPDPEGAPDSDGRRYHGALDWFAAGGTPVHAAVTGDVVEVRRTDDRSGQVFGGTLKIREPGSGRVYAYRHIDPAVTVGTRVRAGEMVGHVTDWHDGPDHIHLEVWRSLTVPGRTSGYWIPNMVDPGALAWTTAAADTASRDPLAGTYLRIVLDGGRLDVTGDRARGALVWIAEHGLRTDRCAVAWRGPGRTTVGVWRGRRDVVAVCRTITTKYL